MKNTYTIGLNYGSLSCRGENPVMERLAARRYELKK